MKISEFVQEIKKYDCGTKTSGSTIALYEMTEYYIEASMFSPREEN